jgi:hypothetical protein
MFTYTDVPLKLHYLSTRPQFECYVSESIMQVAIILQAQKFKGYQQKRQFMVQIFYHITSHEMDCSEFAKARVPITVDMTYQYSGNCSFGIN